MKKKLISLMIVTMMAVSLVACADKKEANNTSSNNKTVTSNSNEDSDNNKEKDAEDNNGTVKVTEDELKEISNENIERLKVFYEKYGLPYSTDNKYNNSVDESRINLVTANVEARNIDTKGVRLIEYQYVNNFTIQATLVCKRSEGADLDLNNSLAKEYAEAIVNEDLDFSDAQKELEKYYENYTNVSKKFEYKIETENYTVTLAAVDNEEYGVNIYSKYEVK